MNRTHRIVINRRTGARQAVSETAKSSSPGAPVLPRAIAIAALVALGFAMPSAAGAAILNWGALSAGDWFDPGNWLEGVVPTLADTANINGPAVRISGIGPEAQVGFIQAGDSTNVAIDVLNGGRMIASGRIALGRNGSGTLRVDGAGSVLRVGNVTLGYGAAGIGEMTISNEGVVSLTGGSEVEVGNAAGGTGTVNLNAGGTLEVGAGQGLRPAVAGATGTFNWSGGTLRVTNGDLSTGIGATLDGTTSTLDTNGFNATLSGALTGPGSLIKTGVGTLNLTGANNYSGGTQIKQGVLAFGSGAALGSSSVFVSGGELRGTSSTAVGNDLRVTGPATVSAAVGTTLQMTGPIWFDSDLSVGAAGQTGIVEFATDAGGYVTPGKIAVNFGTLRITGNAFGNMLNAASETSIAGGATLDLNDHASSGIPIANLRGSGTMKTGAIPNLAVGVAAGDFSGVVEGPGGIYKRSTGTLTLRGANTYTGSTQIVEGTLALAGSGALSGSSAVTVAAGAMFDVQGVTASGTTIGSLAGAGAVALGSKSINVGAAGTSTTFSGTIAGTGELVKQGAGTLTLSGDSLHAGGTSVAGGTLALSGAGSLVSGSKVNVSAGATFDTSARAAANMIVGDLLGDGAVQLGNKTLTVGSGAGTQAIFSGVVSGVGGSLVKQGAGTVWLDGINTFTGLTDVVAGKLVVGSDATKSSARVAGAMNVASGATLGGHGRIGGNVSIASGAHLAPGNSIGTLTIDGDLGIAKGSVLDFEFGAPGTGAVPGLSDSVAVGGNLALNGATLNVSDTGAMGLGLYNLFSYGGALTQTNGGIALGSLPAGSFSLQYLTGSKQVNLISFSPAAVLNFWNANGLASSTAMGGGNGTWSLTQPNWTDDKGSVTAVMQPQPAFAIFGGAAGNVALDNTGGAVSATGMQFASDGYRLSGDALTLVADKASPGPVEVRVGDGSAPSAAWNATVSNVIAGTDGLRKTGAGTLTLQGVNTYSGGTTVSAGTLQISADNNLGNMGGGLALDGGTLRVATGSAPMLSSRAVTLGSAGGTLDLGSNLVALVGGIGGKGGLTVTGAGGTLSAITPNTYEGGTTVQGGATVTVAGLGTLGTGAVQQQTNDTRVSFTSGASAGSNSYSAGRAGAADANNVLAFSADATAASSRLFVNGAGWQAPGVNSLQFSGTSTAAASTITNEGGAVYFLQDATAGSATIVNGNKSLLSFSDASSARGARISNETGGTLDMSGVTSKAGIEIGSLSGAGTVTLGAAKLTLGGLGSNDMLTGGVSGSGGSVVKVGSGTLTLSGASTYTGGTALKEGRLDVGNSAALGTGALAMDDGTTLGFSADGVNIANAIQLTGTNDPVVDTGAFSGTLSGGISGGGFLTKEGTGTLTLAGANTYTGATNVAQGTLRAGAVNTFSAASAHSVAAGATLDLAGYDQSVASLANSGTVSLAGTAAGTTLTVNGNYVGNNGVLKLGTALSGTGPSDRLVINGGTATGKTSVQVANLGGLGALTSGNGIEVVTAQGGATTTAQTTKDAFSLAGGHVDAGAYEYRLYAADAEGAGENWFLRSTTNVVAPGAPAVVTYRPEASLYAALPSQLRQGSLAMLGDVRKRVGDDDVKGSATAPTGSDRRAWARVLSTDIDIQQGGAVAPTSKGRLTGFQAGTDLLATPHWRAGIYVGQLDGDARVNGFASGIQNLGVGRNDLRSQYVGVYGTYTGDSGFYADAVVQSGRHRYTVEPLASAGVGGKGNSLLGSIEVGQAFVIGGSGWTVEPQLQLIHHHMDLNNSAIAGAIAQPQADSGWIARAGVRVKGQIDTGMGALQPYGRFNVYKTSSGADIARFVNGATTTDIAAPTGGTSTELAGGFTLALSQSTSLYGEIGKLWASGGDAKVKSSINGSLGVRVKW
jgi:fibronectin-binding autotransporter adhesin